MGYGDSDLLPFKTLMGVIVSRNDLDHAIAWLPRGRLGLVGFEPRGQATVRALDGFGVGRGGRHSVGRRGGAITLKKESVLSRDVLSGEFVHFPAANAAS